MLHKWYTIGPAHELNSHEKPINALKGKYTSK